MVPRSTKYMYHFKNFLNALASSILISSGAACLYASTHMPTGPYARGTFVSASEFVIYGVTLILLAIAPFSYQFTRLNLRYNTWSKWRTQTVYELSDFLELSPAPAPQSAPIPHKVAAEEIIVFTREERIQVKSRDPVTSWNGKDIQSLIGTILCEGDIRFPVPPVINLPTHTTDTPPSEKELVHQIQTEKWIEAIDCPIHEVLNPILFFQKLAPQDVGMLKMSVPLAFRTVNDAQPLTRPTSAEAVFPVPLVVPIQTFETFPKEKFRQTQSERWVEVLDGPIHEVLTPARFFQRVAPQDVGILKMSVPMAF